MNGPPIALAACAVVAGGCAGGTMTVPRERPTEADVRAAAKTAGRPVFYLGPTFAGLPLTGADARADGALFAYGTCEIDLPAEGGCAVPVQVQNFPFRAADWRRADGCYAHPPVRGIPTARHDGLVLFTETGIVKIYARSEMEDVEAAKALVPAGGRGALRPAPSAVTRIVATRCGGPGLRPPPTPPEAPNAP